jgi:predicted amidophosphoribosyltransferase
MLKWLLLLIDYWPAIYRVIKEILSLIRKIPKNEQVLYRDQLRQAIAYYRTTKKSDLLKILKKKMKEKLYGDQN